MLNVVELGASDSKKGVEEEAGRWGGDVVVEKRRGQRENTLIGEERVLYGGSGCFDVGLVGETYFRPGGGGDGGGDGGVSIGGVVESKFGPMGGDIDRGGSGGDGDLEDIFVKLGNKVGGQGDGSKGEGHFWWVKQSAPILGDCSNVANLLLY